MRTVDETDRLATLFRDQSATVLKYALRRGASLEEAEDLVSETFIVAMRRLEDIPENPGPWLLGTARRLLANEWRGKRRWSKAMHRLMSAAADSDPSLPDPIEAREQRAHVREALNRLPEWDREALSLVSWEGLTPAEAAEAMGCSSAHFSVKLWRARRRLVKEMAASGH